MSKYIELFEKNTIFAEDQEHLIDLLSNNNISILREYMDKKRETFESIEDFLNSAPIQKIWSYFTKTLQEWENEDGSNYHTVNHRYFNSHTGKMFSTYKTTPVVLFYFQEFFYLNYGALIDIDGKFETTDFPIENYALSDDKHFILSKVAPCIVKSHLHPDMIDRLYSHFVYNKPDSMDYQEYEDRNLNFINVISEFYPSILNDVKKVIFSNRLKKDNNRLLSETITNMDMPIGSDYDSFKVNNISTSYIAKAFIELCIEHGAESFVLNTAFETEIEKDELDFQIYWIKSLFNKVELKELFTDKFIKYNQFKIAQFYSFINKNIAKLGLEHASIDEQSLPFYFYALDNDLLDSLYVGNHSQFLLARIENIEKYKDKFVFFNQEAKDKFTEEFQKQISIDPTLSSLNVREKTTERFLDLLISLFSESILENQKDVKKNKYFYSFFIHNKDKYFTFTECKKRIGKEYKDVQVYSGFKDNGLEELIEHYYNYEA